MLRVYLVGMPFAAADQMLVFASYARKDTWRPALVGFISILIYSLTALVLLRPLGLLSLMVADAVKHVVHTIITVSYTHLVMEIGAGYGDIAQTRHLEDVQVGIFAGDRVASQVVGCLLYTSRCV